MNNQNKKISKKTYLNAWTSKIKFVIRTWQARYGEINQPRVFILWEHENLRSRKQTLILSWRRIKSWKKFCDENSDRALGEKM